MSKRRILYATLILLLVPAAVYAVTFRQPSHPGRASVDLSTISITANGNATRVGQPAERSELAHPESTPISLPVVLPATERTTTPVAADASSASVSITATVVERNNTSVIAFDADGISLTIEGVTYNVVNGTGIFNQRSLVVVFHGTVQTGDWTGTLILIGRADQALSDPGTVAVAFNSPQSKLASKFFLELDGTLRLA